MVSLKTEIKKSYNKEILNIFNLISDIAFEEGVNVYLIGGMVRDLLLNNPSIDLDITIEDGSGIDFAKKLASHYGTKPKIYPEFKTATVLAKNGRKIDIATCRKETYPEAGSLPHVEIGNIREDLFRRDFTINAMVITLNKENFGKLLDFHGGLEDLRSQLMRILYKDSFVDDPTRMLRLVRFAARLKFGVEQKTKQCLDKAVEDNLLNTISSDRTWNELKLLLKEKKVSLQIQKLDDYIGLGLIYPSFREEKVPLALFKEAKKNFDRFRRIYSIKKENNKIDVKYWVMNFMILTERLKDKEIKNICKKYNFSRKERKKVLNYQKGKQKLESFFQKAKDLKNSDIYSFLSSFPLESIFIIISKCEEIDINRKIWYFLTKSQFVELEIDGKDLKNLGVPSGPEMEKILKKVLYAKIDGNIQGRENELNYVKNMI